MTAVTGVSSAAVNSVVMPDGYAHGRVGVVHSTSPSDYWIEHINAEAGWRALSGLTLYRSPIGIVDTGFGASQTVLDEARLRRYSASGAVIGGQFGTSSHGLWVTGLAAGDHSGDQRGVNPHSKVVLVDTGKRGLVYESAILAGIRTAIDNGAKVVNVSFGGVASCTDTRARRKVARERWRRNTTTAMNYAQQRDALVVWSAGSDCEKNDDRYLPPAAIADTRRHTWDSHALIVGASTGSRTDACFSRMGEVVSLMAPGQAIAFGPKRPVLDGTSYAAPLVVGAAGLVRAVEHTLSAAQTRAVLLASASHSIMPQSMAMNEAQCIDRYPTGVTADTHPGEATTPRELLNLGRALDSAAVVSSVPLTREPRVMLNSAQRIRVPIGVSVPSTGVVALDVVFLIDQTGSFKDDIDTLQSEARAVAAALDARGLDVAVGVAGFGDYGNDGDDGDVFILHRDISKDGDAFVAALDALAELHGGDAPEAQYQALQQATSEFSWRTGALRVILLATDAPFHNSDTESAYLGAGREAVLLHLEREGVVVIGLQSGDDATAAQQLEELALVTGGSSHQLDLSSSGIAMAIEDGLDDALAIVDVRLEVVADDPRVAGVTPLRHRNVVVGETVTFTVHLHGQLQNSIDPIPQDVYAWAWADGSGLIGRIKIPVVVPSEPSWRLSAAPR